MSRTSGFRHPVRNIAIGLTGLVAALALACGLLGYNPFDNKSSAAPATIGHSPLNAGGLPVGDRWAKTNVQGNVQYVQTMAGTIPDQPIGLPELVITSVATTSDICNVGTTVASYSGVKGLAFDEIAGCHALNNALSAHDHVGCYNAAAGMYNKLVLAIDNARHNGTLTGGDAQFLQHQLDFNFSGFTVGDACDIRFDASDPRGVRPVTMMK